MFIFLFPSIFGGTGCRTGGVEDVRCGKKRLKFYVYFKYEKTTRYMWPYGEKKILTWKKKNVYIYISMSQRAGMSKGWCGKCEKKRLKFYVYFKYEKHLLYVAVRGDDHRGRGLTMYICV